MKSFAFYFILFRCFRHSRASTEMLFVLVKAFAIKAFAWQYSWALSTDFFSAPQAPTRFNAQRSSSLTSFAFTSSKLKDATELVNNPGVFLSSLMAGKTFTIFLSFRITLEARSEAREEKKNTFPSYCLKSQLILLFRYQVGSGKAKIYVDKLFEFNASLSFWTEPDAATDCRWIYWIMLRQSLDLVIFCTSSAMSCSAQNRWRRAFCWTPRLIDRLTPFKRVFATETGSAKRSGTTRTTDDSTGELTISRRGMASWGIWLSVPPTCHSLH